MSASGSPSTTTRSAALPAATVPVFLSSFIARAGTIVASRRASAGVRPPFTNSSSSRSSISPARASVPATTVTFASCSAFTMRRPSGRTSARYSSTLPSSGQPAGQEAAPRLHRQALDNPLLPGGHLALLRDEQRLERRERRVDDRLVLAQLARRSPVPASTPGRSRPPCRPTIEKRSGVRVSVSWSAKKLRKSMFTCSIPS